MKMKNIDPVTFEVVNSGFSHITKLMGYTLQKVSMSPIIYDSVDYSNALFSPKCELIGQTTNVPVHLASMHHSVRESVAHYGIENLQDGDIIVLNDPYCGGTHIPDITFTAPIFYRNRLVTIAASRGHWADLGGGAPGGRMPTATHIVQEGLRIPPTRIYNAGKIVPEIRDIIVSNSRVPKQVLGDLEAHKAALLIAKRHVLELVEKYGPDVIAEHMEATLDYTEMQTREAIRGVPDGVYEAECYIDCNGIDPESLLVKGRMDVKGDEILMDFTGTAPQTRGNVNYPYAGSQSAVYFALKFFLARDAVPNGGMYRPVHIILPEGSIVNAKWPACTYAGNLTTSETIADVVWKCLEQAVPEMVPGLPYGESNGFHVGGSDYAKGNSFAVIDLPPGGWGGHAHGDGMSATYSRHGNCMDLDIELAEKLYPLRFVMRELIVDSGGVGKFRGGLSMRQGYHFNFPVEVGHTTSRTKTGPEGINGGRNGRPGRSIKNYGMSDAEVISGWSEDGTWKICMFNNKRFEKDNSFTIETQGGGGWGDPKDRDPERIRADLEAGYITPESAEREYGFKV
jgi:N-methylhydantoinase B/oxoprolinase/acetone carboxylase alpha subunit